jgi:pimeloyl-ACP methyl ester carboxylesterase
MPPDEPRAAPLPDAPGAESTFREVNGVTLHVVAAGDPADPLVVLLHGFPEFWYEWRAYVEPLVAAGYRVLVPDQRGYNRSERPDGVGSYRTSELSRDVADLVATEDRESAHVVGHDWGAAVAWDLALRRPEVVDRLAIVNVPHPTVFEETLRSNPRQLRNSWYVFYFQLPRLPEWGARRNDFALLVRAMRDEAHEGAFTDEDVERYRRAWAREGALTAMVNWYRGAARYRERPPRTLVRAPTLVAWGEQDQALVPEMAGASVEHCRDGRLERFPDATHWLPHERPDEVLDLLTEHLSA